MRIVHRLLGAILLTSLSAAPLGVAAEGYVCPSGARMVHQAKSACVHCAPAQESAGATFERPCCVYVGATSLPPLLTAAQVSLAAPARAIASVPPGVTVSASAPRFVEEVQYDPVGSGSSPPGLQLIQAVHLRN